jgi:hypothetical protein
MTQPQRGEGLVVYVTSHGFGHLHRTAAVLNQTPRDLPVVIKCHENLFAGWTERLTRPVELVPYVSDVGAIGPPGDSARVDPRATFEQALAMHKSVVKRLDDEADWLRDRGARLVLADAPALPLEAARRAGVGSFLLANFTWADIYAGHARKLGRSATQFVTELKRVYQSAGRLLRVEPALSMRWLNQQETLGMVVHPSRNRRRELASLLGLSSRARLVYAYLGRYGQADLDWSRLERYADKEIHFVSYHGPDTAAPANLHLVPSADWPGGDLIASCDAILAKAGYGTATEAMASRTPMIYPPRRDFAEYRALDRALRGWGGGVPIAARAFHELALDHALKQALANKPGPAPFSAQGAQQVARRLVQCHRSGRV